MTRERSAREVDGSLSGQRVVMVLERLACTHGLPKVLWVDNGPEFTSKALDAWAHRRGVRLAFSRPGTPTDNPFLEAFNARFREECLNQQWSTILSDLTRRCTTKRRPSTKRPGVSARRFKPQVTNLPDGPELGCGPITDRCIDSLIFPLMKSILPGLARAQEGKFCMQRSVTEQNSRRGCEQNQMACTLC
jgi:transposase InsO family protein